MINPARSFFTDFCPSFPPLPSTPPFQLYRSHGIRFLHRVPASATAARLLPQMVPVIDSMAVTTVLCISQLDAATPQDPLCPVNDTSLPPQLPVSGGAVPRTVRRWSEGCRHAAWGAGGGGMSESGVR